MKGIVLAGGAGTRLYPLTMVTSKQLLPVYDKPMIYYPLSTPSMFMAVIDMKCDGSIQITASHHPFYRNGLKFFTKDGGLEAEDITAILENAENGFATIFGYHVEDPERFGVMEFDDDLNILSVEEKPTHPKSNYCITGLYFYPAGVADMAAKVKPSARGELEITTMNELYLRKGLLKGRILGRGYAWLDTGTVDTLVEAGTFVQMIEKRQGVKISAPEEIAWRNGWISKETLLEAAKLYGKSPYGKHLLRVAEGRQRY